MQDLIIENKHHLLQRHLYQYLLALINTGPIATFPKGTVELGPKEIDALDMDYDSETNQLTLSYNGNTKTLTFIKDTLRHIRIEIAREIKVDPFMIEREIYHRMMPVFDYWISHLYDKKSVALILLAILSQGGTSGSFSVKHEDEIKQIHYEYRQYGQHNCTLIIKPGNYREAEISIRKDIPKTHDEFGILVQFLKNASPVHDKYSWEKVPLIPIIEIEEEIASSLERDVQLAMSMYYYDVLRHEAKDVNLPEAYEDFLELSSDEQTELFDKIFKGVSSPIPRKYAETILFLSDTKITCKRDPSRVLQFDVKWDATGQFHDVSSHSGYGVVEVYMKDRLLTKYTLSNLDENPDQDFSDVKETIAVEHINTFDMHHPCVKSPFSPVAVVRKCPDLMGIWLMFHM